MKQCKILNYHFNIVTVKMGLFAFAIVLVIGFIAGYMTGKNSNEDQQNKPSEKQTTRIRRLPRSSEVIHFPGGETIRAA